MKFIDTHIHLQDYKTRYATDIINESEKVGVEKFICVGTSPQDWERVEKLYQEYPQKIIPAFGLHPWYLEEQDEEWAEQLDAILERNPKAWVGECGLDGAKGREIKKQEEYFIKQIEIANRRQRPLIIHAVKCQHDMENLLTQLPKKSIFHSYNGRMEMLKKIISYGFYVSFSFSILKNKECQEIVKSIPDKRILIETDGPYQSPIKGTETYPKQLSELAEMLADIRKADRENFIKLIYQNSKDLINE